MFSPLVCECITFVKYMQRPEWVLGPLETGVIDGCELLCCYWESNLGSLREQPVLSHPSNTIHQVYNGLNRLVVSQP